jgi:outer membrane protein assembly factor BamD
MTAIFAAFRQNVHRPTPRLIPLVFALLGLGACSEFNKALKSTDLDYKWKVAQDYYERGRYDQSIPLMEELIVLTRGTQRSVEVNYQHAKSHFLMKDYTLAGYYLSNFVRTFPTSPYAEECAFLSAYCYYKNSPDHELDQTDTRTAIDQMQLFMVRHPNSTLKDSCNTLIDRMRTKLEVKAFEGAMQYYHMRNFQAAGVAFRNFNREWPNSQFREEAMWLTLKSDHELAINSVEAKKRERLAEAIRSYRNFADAFPQSPLLVDAERIHRIVEQELGTTATTP